MSENDPKDVLRRYLRAGRAALLWKLEGLSEYDVRRPLTPTGTNLLGLVKHVAGVEFGYFGDSFGRAYDEQLPWVEDDAEPDADLWVTPDETREQIISLYERAAAFTDATVEALDLEAIGRVPWWPEGHDEVTLHRVLVHMISETARHAGQADIMRESIDGAVGLRPGNDNMSGRDAASLRAHRERIEQAARSAPTAG